MVEADELADDLPAEQLDVGQKDDVRVWAERLGCTEGQLLAAVMAVGSGIEDVRRHLCKH